VRRAESVGATGPRCGNRRSAGSLITLYPEKQVEIAAMLDAELTKGPDFARCRRGQFRNPPRVNTDRNFCARVMFIADMIERKTWKNRAKGKHGGELGRSAITLLRVLLFVVRKTDGCIYPSYDTLAGLSRMSRRTVIAAMQALEFMGFVTIHRRVKRITTPLGLKMVQDSNAYEYHLPRGLGALAWEIFKPATSECRKFPARSMENNKQEEKEAIAGGMAGLSGSAPPSEARPPPYGAATAW
jgi:hypothetical protein